MEVLSNWQNIKWDKYEEIIVKWITIDIYTILETAKIELELNKKENRGALKNLIFHNEAIEELNSEMANDILTALPKQKSEDNDFIKKWYKNTVKKPLSTDFANYDGFEKVGFDGFDKSGIEQVTYSDSECPIEIVVIDDYIRDAFSTRPPTPPIRVDSRRKPLLVLDLDETLVHSMHYSHPNIDKEDCIYLAEFDYHVYKRPFLEYFLTSVSERYDIGIWSAGTDEYVETIIDLIMPSHVEPIFVFGRSMCQLRYVHGFRVYVKPLRLLQDFGYCVNKMLIVDDSPEKCVDNFSNAIIPRPYLCNDNDGELLDLLHYLEQIAGSKDLTNHMHYRWRDFV